jgi:hypothetical protein
VAAKIFHRALVRRLPRVSSHREKPLRELLNCPGGIEPPKKVARLLEV